MSRLIIALDVDSFSEMKAIVESTKSEVSIYKIGLQLFTSEGPSTIKYLKEMGKGVFLDLKLHEISNSVASAIHSAGTHGVDMVTVHASGGQQMMKAAVEAASAFPNLKILALTVVTGLDNKALSEIGFELSAEELTIRLASLAASSGCHGVIASSMETEKLRGILGSEMLIVTPGIRPAGSDSNDQQRVGTPTHAMISGASYIVVGRPVVQASDSGLAAREINEEILKAQNA